MFLDFFDQVYVINLPERVDRRMQMKEQLDQYKIPFTFFEATKDENGVKGLVETMKRLFRHCLDKKHQRVIILEDDASFLVGDPVSFLKEVIPQIPKDFQLFHLGLNLLAPPKRISENVLKVVDCYSTHAICYSAEGMKVCLERLEEVPLMPYDIFIRQEIICRGATYCTFPMLATQRESYSDIEKGYPLWGKLMTMTYAQMTRNI
jgi:GR25 family glycosyltransferase involved in LPS biosynthesis